MTTAAASAIRPRSQDRPADLRRTFIPMEEAMRTNLSVRVHLIPAVRTCGELFWHADGHDMALEVAYQKHGDAVEAEIDPDPAEAFGYVLAVRKALNQ